MDYVHFIMKNPRHFSQQTEADVLLLLAVVPEEMYSIFLMEYENYSFVEALKYLADRAGVTSGTGVFWGVRAQIQKLYY